MFLSYSMSVDIPLRYTEILGCQADNLTLTREAHKVKNVLHSHGCFRGDGAIYSF